MEQRVLQAAREELAERGIDGFSIRQVAARAGVARPSILLRWPDWESLIIDAVDDIAELPPLAETGSLRGDLAALTDDLDALLRPPILDLQHKLVSEATRHPSLYRRFQRKVMRPGGLRARTAFTRAISRGELPAATDVRWLIDALIGGLLLRTISSPELVPPRAEVRAGLIDLLLNGAGYIEVEAKSSPPAKGPRQIRKPSS